jgi:hypothetical protein
MRIPFPERKRRLYTLMGIPILSMLFALPGKRKLGALIAMME